MSLQDLLVVQDIDIHIQQVVHQIESLPERVELKVLGEEVRGLNEQMIAAQEAVNLLRKEERDLEHEADDVAARIKTLDQQLYGGSIAGAKEMQAIQTEIDHLKVRRGEFDEKALAIMDNIEPAEKTVNELSIVLDQKARRIEELTELANKADSDLKAQAEVLVKDRNEKISSVDVNIRDEYDKLRQRLGGIGAAALVHGTCGGCHMSFSAAELESLAKSGSGGLVHCEQCGRILVL